MGEKQQVLQSHIAGKLKRVDLLVVRWAISRKPGGKLVGFSMAFFLGGLRMDVR